MDEPEILPNRTVCRVELIKNHLSPTTPCRARKRGSQSLQAVSRGVKEISVHLRKSVSDSRSRSLLAFSSLLPTTYGFQPNVRVTLRYTGTASHRCTHRHVVGPYSIVYTTTGTPAPKAVSNANWRQIGFFRSEPQRQVIATVVAIGSIGGLECENRCKCSLLSVICFEYLGLTVVLSTHAWQSIRADTFYEGMVVSVSLFFITPKTNHLAFRFTTLLAWVSIATTDSDAITCRRSKPYVHACE